MLSTCVSELVDSGDVRSACSGLKQLAPVYLSNRSNMKTADSGCLPVARVFAVTDNRQIEAESDAFRHHRDDQLP
jgi:hypothetical protein